MPGVALLEGSEDPLALRSRVASARRLAPEVRIVVVFRDADVARAARLDDAVVLVAAPDAPFPVERVLLEHPDQRYAFYPAGADLTAPAWDDVAVDHPVIAPSVLAADLPSSGVLQHTRPTLAWLSNRGALERLSRLPLFPQLADAVGAADEATGVGLRSARAARRSSLPVMSREAGSLSRRSSLAVLIPHYECEPYLRRCLGSIVAQTRPADAVVVVDDGSREPPVAAVSAFPGVTLLRSDRNAGPYELIQHVIDRTDFDAYCFLDADDWCAEDRIEWTLLQAEASGAEMIGCQELSYVESRRQFVGSCYGQDVTFGMLAAPSYSLLHPSSIVSRALLTRIGGFAGLPFGADFELQSRAVFAGRVLNTDRFSYFRRIREGSLTTAPATGLQSEARRRLHAAIVGRWRQNIEARRSGAPLDLSPLQPPKGVTLTHLRGPRLALGPVLRAPAAPEADRAPELDPATRYVARRIGRSLVRLGDPTTQLLDSCRSLATPAEIVRAFVKDAPRRAVSESACHERLRDAHARGALMSEEALRREIAARLVPATPPPISAVCIPTSGDERRRAHALACIEATAAGLRALHRSTPLCVHDDHGTEGDDRMEGRLAALARRLGQPIRFASTGRKRRFARALAERTGAPAEVVRFALFGDARVRCSVGANRNGILLDQAGGRFVSIDDDVLAGRVRPRARGGPATEVTSDVPDACWFEDFGGELGEDLRDIVAEHDDVLGRSPWRTLLDAARPLDCRNMSERLRALLVSGKGLVRLSYTGMVGDCALPDPARLWLLGGPSRQRFLGSVARPAGDPRAILRVAAALTLTDNTASAYGLSMGVDATAPLPPFFPVLTGEDFLFARMALRFDPGAVVAHLPVVVEHRPPHERPFSRDAAVLSGGETLTATVMSALLTLVAPHEPFEDPSGQHARVTRGLRELGALEVDELAGVIDEIIRAGKQGYVERAQQLLRAHDFAPLPWSRDLLDQLAVTERRLQSSERLAPADIGGEAPIGVLRDLIRQFADLMAWWPSLLEAAQAMRFDGTPLSEAV